MELTFCSKGAALEVTGSRHFLSINGQRIQIDCGAFQGKRKETEEKNRSGFENVEQTSALILTHGHYDHCGLIPYMVKKGYKGNIYTTPASRDIASLIMMDSAHIQARDKEYLEKQARKKGEPFSWEPLYTEQDVVQATELFVGFSYHRPFYILPGVMAEFFDAGHILGSALVLLTLQKGAGWKENLRILFTGDLGRKGKPIIRDPEPVPAPDIIVLEGTYGDRLHDTQEEVLSKLARIVNETVDRGGKLLIPAFAVERTQELVYLLHLLVDGKQIPDIPIYVDSPMATNATTIFQVHPECYDQEIHEAFLKHHKNPFGFNNLHFVTSVAESKELNKLKIPAIIISADGMCEAGRILHHLANNIQDPRTTLMFVGYTAEHTLGRRILSGQKEVKIFGETYTVRAKVEELSAMSAHADYREIGEYLQALDTTYLKSIYLVHGEQSALDHLSGYLESMGFPKPKIVKPERVYSLI
ncbi:MAG: MBL fold metallo-hydrolase [Spirochaetes bacterium]|nr:MBL fold metallo-hydrolase [Spirochaetota bacterium]